jgi:hypothetical protein
LGAVGDSRFDGLVLSPRASSGLGRDGHEDHQDVSHDGHVM